MFGWNPPSSYGGDVIWSILWTTDDTRQTGTTTITRLSMLCLGELKEKCIYLDTPHIKSYCASRLVWAFNVWHVGGFAGAELNWLLWLPYNFVLVSLVQNTLHFCHILCHIWGQILKILHVKTSFIEHMAAIFIKNNKNSDSVILKKSLQD